MKKEIRKSKREKVLKPKFLITYLCTECEIDSACVDISKPICFCCESDEHLIEIKRQKFTKEVFFDRLNQVTKRLEDNLRNAYQTRDEDDNNEDELLDALIGAKKIKEKVYKISKAKINILKDKLDRDSKKLSQIKFDDLPNEDEWLSIQSK